MQVKLFAPRLSSNSLLVAFSAVRAGHLCPCIVHVVCRVCRFVLSSYGSVFVYRGPLGGRVVFWFGLKQLLASIGRHNALLLLAGWWRAAGISLWPLDIDGEAAYALSWCHLLEPFDQ